MLARGTELARRAAARFDQVYGLTAHARLKVALGDRRGGQVLLDEAHQALYECVDPGLPRTRRRRRARRTSQAPAPATPGVSGSNQRSRARRASVTTDPPDAARDRRPALHLLQHRQDAHQEHLPKARSFEPSGGRCGARDLGVLQFWLGTGTREASARFDAADRARVFSRGPTVLSRWPMNPVGLQTRHGDGARRGGAPAAVLRQILGIALDEVTMATWQ